MLSMRKKEKMNYTIHKLQLNMTYVNAKLLGNGAIFASFSGADFKNLFEMYLSWGIITIPVTVYILYECFKELFDFLFNRKKVLELLKRAEKISIEQFETEINSCLMEMKTLQEKLKSEDSIERKTYWKENWNYGKSEWEIQREQKIRTLFNPDK